MAKANANTQDPKADGAETATVMEVAITDGEDQPVASDCPVGEPKVNRRGTKKKPVTRGAESASGGDKTSALSASKAAGRRTTVRVGTKELPKGGKTQGTRGKPRKPSTESKSAAAVKGTPKKPSSAITMGQLADSYAKHLEALGKSQGTVHSYSIEMKTAVRHFGAETKVTTLTAKAVGAYFDSDTVTKNRRGREKDSKTIAKTRRVLRLALTWLAEVGVIPAAPIPETKKPAKKK